MLQQLTLLFLELTASREKAVFSCRSASDAGGKTHGKCDSSFKLPEHEGGGDRAALLPQQLPHAPLPLQLAFSARLAGGGLSREDIADFGASESNTHLNQKDVVSPSIEREALGSPVHSWRQASPATKSDGKSNVALRANLCSHAGQDSPFASAATQLADKHSGLKGASGNDFQPSNHQNSPWRQQADLQREEQRRTPRRFS